MRVAIGALAVLVVLSSSRAASAQVSVAGGYFDTADQRSIGAAVSLGLFKTPVIPLTVEGTVAVPFDGNGFATTLDLRFKAGGTTLGGGVGGGNMGRTDKLNVMYDALLSQQIMPHLAVELRIYAGPFRPSSFFAGVRATL